MTAAGCGAAEEGLHGPFSFLEEEAMEVRVYYEDTDVGGVVYHANYLKYFERGRTEFLRQRGLAVGELHRAGFIFPVIRMEIDFRAPALHDDLLRVETSVREVGKATFTVAQKVLRPADGRLLAEAMVILACIGPTLRPKRLPTELLMTLADAR
jgi:acyl-CoA thioester hydrolase